MCGQINLLDEWNLNHAKHTREISVLISLCLGLDGYYVYPNICILIKWDGLGGRVGEAWDSTGTRVGMGCIAIAEDAGGLLQLTLWLW